MYIFLSLILIFGYNGARETRADNIEPTCYSRFDYDMRMFETVADTKLSQKALVDTVNKLRDVVKELGTKVDMLQLTIGNLTSNIDSQQEAIQIIDSNVQQIKEKAVTRTTNQPPVVKAAPIIAFTVKGPSDGSGGSLLFDTVVTNEGNLYAASTGNITCETPGLYFFSFHIIKKRASTRVDRTGCEIRKNGSILVVAYTDPADAHADLGSYGASTSVYVKLDVGDVIHLKRSFDAATMDPRTTFSGALIVAQH